MLNAHSRSCFNAQRNRTFIYHVVFNETEVRLFYFDHCGLMVSNWINYRSDPNVLIRMILLTCNSDSSAVGLDPAVKFREASGDDADTEKQQFERVYTLKIGDKDMELTVIALTWASNAISGRKTLCWRVKDKDDNVYILKECSRHVEREPAEWKLLEEVKGLEGVGQMVGYQVSQKISEMRSSIGMESPSELKDRERYFLLLEMYGYPIYHFSSRLQLLEALRDAVQGHWNLWKKKGVLHRDISKNNILLGNSDAAKGFRGVLIDLDLAIYTKRDKSLFEKDSRTGTHAFQSFIILSTQPHQARYAAPHDYLDDLESFFWVLIWLTMGYDVVDRQDYFSLTPTKQDVEDLKPFEARPSIAADRKHKILSKKKPRLADGWGATMQNMVSEMRRFLAERVEDKETARDERILLKQPFKHHPQPLLDPEIQTAAEADYPLFIGFIDEAIEKLRLAPYESSVSQVHADDSAETGDATVALGTKRARGPNNGDDEDSLGSKRSRGEGSRTQASTRIDFGRRSSESGHRRSPRLRAKRGSKSQVSKLRE
ncbi:hypothetical protein BJ165DRAFT_1067039 [Panaeolus papilionaceus]|nr:hypothetical protein BJ165DRAFT_1067039 [Panaeolus papilionaceus]